MQTFLNVANSFFIYSMIGVSCLLIYNVTKFFHIAHAITITIASYFVYLFYVQIGIPLWITIPLSVFFATILGMLTEILVYRPLRKMGTKPMLLLIASIGIYTILQNAIMMIWGNGAKSFGIIHIRAGHQICNAYITDVQIITIFTGLILLILYLLFMKYNKAGRDIRAVSYNLELSNIVGINSDKVILLSYAISSCIASIVGILVAIDTSLSPTMGFNLLIYGVVTMIIGGLTSIAGVLGGALLLATLQHLIAYYIGSQWMEAIAYVILILFLLWKPLGFAGRRLKKVEI